MSIGIEALNGLGPIESKSVEFSGQVNDPAQLKGSSFVQMLHSGVSEVNQTLQSANMQLENLALDKPVSTHELMITMEKAKLQLQMTIEVRNKLVEGYQELMRMQL